MGGMKLYSDGDWKIKDRNNYEISETCRFDQVN